MRTFRRLAALIALAVIVATTAPAQVGSTGSSESSTGGRATTVIYSLTINSNVRGATIFVNNVRQDEFTPSTIRLRRGSYDIRVEARGYEPFSTTLNLTSNRTLFARLASSSATVVLQVPADLLNNQIRDPWRMIDFYVDGRLRSEAQVQIEPGYRRIAIVSGGLRFENEFFFEAGRFYTLELLMRASLFSTN